MIGKKKKRRSCGQIRNEMHFRNKRYASRNISIRRRLFFDSLEILAVDQTLDPLLDHSHVGNKSGGKLRKHFADELGVHKRFPLSTWI